MSLFSDTEIKMGREHHAAVSADIDAAKRAKREKRERLKEIVNRLGELCSPAEIKQECYRVGFGEVNNNMLCMVRNELFPSREKRYSRGSGKEYLTIKDYSGVSFIHEITCRFCGSHNTRAARKNSRRSPGHNTTVKDQHGNITHQIRLCMECDAESIIPWDGARVNTKRILSLVCTHKKCCKCKEMLPRSAYGLKTNDPQLIRSSCKKCLNKHRASTQLITTLRKYGMSLIEYQAILMAQDYKCAICFGNGKKKQNGVTKLVIDHCHATGKFRGLLCDLCNQGLGCFGEDPGAIATAMKYLAINSRKEARHGSR